MEQLMSLKWRFKRLGEKLLYGHVNRQYQRSLDEYKRQRAEIRKKYDNSYKH